MGGCAMPNSNIFVSCDWYSLSCHLLELGSTPFVPDGWKLQPMGRTSVWAQRWYLMNPEGIKAATLLMEPISPVIKADRAVVEISNVYLYRDDFHRILDIVLDVFPLVVDGVQRCDLCADFEMLPSRWQVALMLEDGRAYLKGVRRGVGWWSKDGKQRHPHQLSWGGKDSAFKWKLYNKHKELWEGGTCSKPYIEEAWRAAGLEPSKVWRLEVSVTSVNRLENLSFANRDFREWFDRATEIYRALYADKFVVREAQGHADRRDDDVLMLLDIHGDKMLRHKQKSEHEIESDVERRIVCKLWKEFTDAEVRCNDFAMQGLRDHIMYMFQKRSNVMAVCRRFRLTEADIMAEF